MRALQKFKLLPLSDVEIKQFVLGQYVFNTETQVLQGNIHSYQLSFKETEILKRLCTDLNKMVEKKIF